MLILQDLTVANSITRRRRRRHNKNNIFPTFFLFPNTKKTAEEFEELARVEKNAYNFSGKKIFGTRISGSPKFGKSDKSVGKSVKIM